MKTLVLNASVLGAQPKGLGVYAEHCLDALQDAFRCKVAGSYYRGKVSPSNFIKTPESISLGAPGQASLKRLIYSFKPLQGGDSFTYSPTHHGIFGTNNQVITIHDLIFLEHPESRSVNAYFKHVLPLAIKRTRGIFTVSHSEKKRLVSYYDLDPEKVYVVPNGVDSRKFKKNSEIDVVKDPYLLVVGASFSYKNIAELINNARYWKHDFELKVVSSSAAQRAILGQLAEREGVADRIKFMGYVSDEELVRLYQNCAALVFPSLREGYGIPPLEAMASGRPVIASNTEVHQEVLCDAPFYITPGESDTWRTAFQKLCTPFEVDAAIARGDALVKLRTWERSANLLRESLLSVEPDLAQLLLHPMNVPTGPITHDR